MSEGVRERDAGREGRKIRGLYLCVELQHGEKASRYRGQEDDEEAHV